MCYRVKFNGKKRKLLIFKGKGCKIGIKKIEDNGDTIHSSEIEDHLGHRTSVSDKDSIISAAIASSIPLSAAIASFWKAFNLLMSGGCLYSVIKSKLFKQYWCSFVWLKCKAFNY